MTYKLLDSNGIEIKLIDLQDKGPWCRHGFKKEQVFLEYYGEKFNLILNPEKHTNPYAPDLYDTASKRVADLKTQNTPFFQARVQYGIDPQYAVTFNHKDRERYQARYPEIDVYFWIDWQAIRFVRGKSEIRVKHISGVWKIQFSQLQKVLQNAPLHSYAQRQNDTKGNAKCSYVIDLQHPSFIRLL